MVNGAYFSKLTQYGVGQPRMAPAVNIQTNPAPNLSFTDKSVVDFVKGQIANGNVPPASSGADMIYAVVMPVGASSADHATTCDGSPGSCIGYHGWATANDGSPFAWAWSLNYDTVTLSHELFEAMTDPNPSNPGVYVTVQNPFGSPFNLEIGDMCGCHSASQNGQYLQSYWSNQDNACVLPSAWNGLYQYNGSPHSWTQVASFPVRQIAAGAGDGLVVTDTNDNAYVYNGTPNSWSQLGANGAMFAVAAGNEILRITQDTTQAWRFSGFSFTSPSWTQVGYDTVAVYAGGGTDIGIGYDGRPYRFLGGNPLQLQQLGSAPGDQFEVSESGRMYALLWDHSNIVSRLPSSGWKSYGASASAIFVGGQDSLGATKLDPTKLIFSYNGSSWNWKGSPAPSFAVVGSNMLAATWWNGAVLLANNVNVNESAWTGIGSSTVPGKIVGHGDVLYATLDPVLTSL
jgi:hypothetical protein